MIENLSECYESPSLVAVPVFAEEGFAASGEEVGGSSIMSVYEENYGSF